MFTSTAKITFAGSGVATIASSIENVRQIKEKYVSDDWSNKINQLLHARFQNYDDIKTHMEKHAKILRPKFEAVSEILNKNLSGLGIAS